MRPVRFLMATAAITAVCASVQAAPFTNIRVGDRDGFGFGVVGGPMAANGGAADTNGNSLLEQTEFLPDLNGDGSLAQGSGDNFDNRSPAEIGQLSSTITGGGFIDSGSTGAKWTDIAVSISSGSSQFPDPGGAGLPNEPTFEFRFFVASADIVVGSTLFFNLVFGDYDISPADIDLTFDSAAARSVALTTQGGGDDGLIQAATTTLQFNEVFTAATGGWDGFLSVHLDAPSEPYMAFDFVELSLDQIPFEPVPAPASLTVLGLGMFGLLLLRRRKAA